MATCINETALWHLDQRINDRGLCIDTELVDSAITTVERAKEALGAKAKKLTGGELENLNKRDALLAFVLEAYGIDLPNLQAATLERRIQDQNIPPELAQLLEARLQVSTTSTAKYKALQKAVGKDGRLRGALQYCGASRTGRWSGRLFQPQNLPRPTLKKHLIPVAIDAIKNGCADLVFDNVMEAASSVIRGVIVAPPGSKLCVTDLANIEGRAMAWLAGEQWKLDAFSAFDLGVGHDNYKLAYARAFNVPIESVTDDQRQIGKVMELFLQYEGGVGAFTTGALAYGIDLDAMASAVLPTLPSWAVMEAKRLYAKSHTKAMSEAAWIACDALKRMWRAAHPGVTQLWRDLAKAFELAAVGKKSAVGPLEFDKAGAWLRIRLPSGRFLCYPSPKVEYDEKGRPTLSYLGVNQYSRKWTRIKTHGGKLAENVIQAISRDVLAENLIEIAKTDYAPVLTVHDEVLTEAPDTDAYSVEELSELLAAVPWWAEGMPLAAKGFEDYRYKKD